MILGMLDVMFLLGCVVDLVNSYESYFDPNVFIDFSYFIGVTINNE